MKKTLLISLLIATMQAGKAQDTITKFGGDKIAAKILEVSNNELKYRRLDSPDGPIYSEYRANILSVKYSNGVEEEYKAGQFSVPEEAKPILAKPVSVFTGPKLEAQGHAYFYYNQRLPMRDLMSMLSSSKNDKVQQLVDKSKRAHRRQFLGFAAFPCGIITIASLAAAVNGDEPQLMSLAIIGGIGTVAFPVISDNNKRERHEYLRKAIEEYNK